MSSLYGRKPKPSKFIREAQPTIPHGKLTYCVGIEKTFKSTFMCHLAVDLLHNELIQSKKRIHLCLAEDDIDEDTLPRLMAAGLTGRDKRRIRIKDGTPWLFPKDLDEFGQYIVEHEIALAVLDPVDMIIPDISNSRSVQTLTDLRRIAELTGCAIIFVGHINKGGFKSVRSALGGTRRMLAVCRSVFVWGKEPRFHKGMDLRGGTEFVEAPDEPCSVLTCVYSSGTAEWEPVMYEQIKVPKPGDKGRDVITLEPVKLAIGESLPYTPLQVVNYESDADGQSGGGDKAAKGELARALILRFLGLADPERGLTASDLKEAVTLANISQATFERARAELREEGLIEQWQDKDDRGKTTAHYWRLVVLQVPDAPE